MELIISRGWKSFEGHDRAARITVKGLLKAILVRVQKEKRRVVDKASIFL